MYAVCSIGGVVVVVEHICDETKRAVWPPPFEVGKYELAAFNVVVTVVDGKLGAATLVFVS